MFPSKSCIFCLGLPSAHHVSEGIIMEYDGDMPGAKTQIALVTTCKIAVRWKNGAAPIVVPGILVVILISPLEVLEAI